MSKNFHKGTLAGLSILIVSLIACGGGGDAGDNPGNLPNIADSYLYYITDRSVGSELIQVDPANPPTSSDPKNSVVSTVSFASSFFEVTPFPASYDIYDLSSLDVSGVSFEPSIVTHTNSGYSRFGSALSGPNTITSVSTAVGGTLCEHDNYSTANREYYFSETSDDGCSTITRRQMVTSQMSPTDTPLDVPVMPLTYLFDRQFQLTGWLADNSGMLTRYDANFASPVNIAPMPSGVDFLYAWPAPSGKYLVMTYVTGGPNEIYIYDSTLNSFTSVYTASTIDGNVLLPYHIDQNGFVFQDADKIYRADWEFANPPQVIASEADLIEPLFVNTTDIMVYTYSSAINETILVALDLATGNKTTLDNIASGLELQSSGATNERIFYNISGTATQRAESIRLNNTGKQSFTNARWTGLTYGNQLDQQANYTDYKAILLTNILPGQTNLDGTMLESYDAITMNKVGDLGALPNGLDDNFYIIGPSNGLLFSANLSSNFSSEVFYLSALDNNSLQRVTDNNLSDYPLHASFTRTGEVFAVSGFSAGGKTRSEIKQNISDMWKWNRNLLMRKPGL